MTVLEEKNLKKIDEAGDTVSHALGSVNFTVEQGEVVAIAKFASPIIPIEGGQIVGGRNA